MSRRHKVIHTTKLFGGKETAEEVHRKLAWGPHARCRTCRDPLVVVKYFCHMSPTELLIRLPQTAAMVSMQNEGKLPVWESKYGPMVLFHVRFACQTHLKDTETEMARMPSYILVEIDRGPGKDKVVVQVPGGFDTPPAAA